MAKPQKKLSLTALDHEFASVYQAVMGIVLPSKLVQGDIVVVREWRYGRAEYDIRIRIRRKRTDGKRKKPDQPPPHQ